MVARRLERSLTLWTDTGVQHFGAVIDFIEGPPTGSGSDAAAADPLLHVARESLIRFESALHEHLEVISVEVR